MTDVITFVYIYATNTPHLADVLASIVFVLIGCTTMTIFHCTGHFTGCLPRINLPPPEMQSCHPPLPSLAAANSQNCNSLLPSIQPFPGRGGIPPFPLPRVFSSLPSSVRSQMKYNPPAGGRTRTGGPRGAAGDTVSGARLSEIGSFVPLLEGRRGDRRREGKKG